MNALSCGAHPRYHRAMPRLLYIALAMGLIGCIGADSDRGDIVTYENSDGPPDHVEVGDLDADPRDSDELTPPEEFERPQESEEPPDDAPPPKDLTLGPDDRLAPLLLPEDPGDDPLPLVVLLHGYGFSAAYQDRYFGLSEAQADRPFYLMLPQGSTDLMGQPFWNATSYCCDFYGSGIDDRSYLADLIDEARQHPDLDVDSVHLVGHSNGGFMAYELACDPSISVDSVVALGASSRASASSCSPSHPVSTLHIHGSMDAVIYYSGVFAIYPGARALARRWADLNDCSSTSAIDDYIALEALIPGNETSRRRYDQCPSDAPVELWTILGGAHIPTLNDRFTDHILDFSLSATPD